LILLPDPRILTPDYLRRNRRRMGSLLMGGCCCASACDTAGSGTSVDVTFSGFSAVCAGCVQVPNKIYTGCSTSTYVQGVAITLDGTYNLPWVSSSTHVETYASSAVAGTSISYNFGSGGVCGLSATTAITIVVDIMSTVGPCLIGRIAAWASALSGCVVAFAYTDMLASVPNAHLGQTINNAACGQYFGFSYGNNGVISGVVVADGGTALVTYNP